jgi:hypothetical protein
MMRRWGVACSALALSAGLALQPVSSSAQAGAVEIAKVIANDSGGMSWTTGATCTSSPGTGAEPELDLPVNGGWRTVHMSRTGSRYATTQMAGTSDTSARVSSDARGATRLEVKATTTARATPSSASPDCTVRYSATGGAGIQVAVTRRSWIVVRSSVTSRGGFGGELYVEATDSDFVVESVPGKGITRLVTPQTYQLIGALAAEVDVPAGSATARSSSASMVASLAVLPVGTRRTHTGNGRPFVTAGHRNCAQNRTLMTLTRAARTKARSITFFADGQRRVVLRGRALQRSSILLTRLAPRKFGLVRAEIVLRSGAKRVTQSTSWPCA